jgi:tripeptide aminopeptidase
VADSPIVKDFLEIVSTPSHSRQERAVADLLAGRLAGLGLEVREDLTGEAIGGDTGNLLARWPGDPDIEPILLSAHMDRVANPGRIEARIEGDRIVSDGTTILGADDATGLAAIIDGIRRVKGEGARHGDVELALTVAEEVGLKGSLHMDYSAIRAKRGYVIDCGGPVGVVVNQAPTQMTVKILIHGKSAHAGMAPEDGVNAIRLGALAIASLREGRLSPVSTSNFGVIKGGSATNIVCDLLEIKGEARSHDPAELKAYLAEVDAAFGRLEEMGGRAELKWFEEYLAYDVPKDDAVITLADKALKAIGREMTVVRGGGGLDANRMNLKGIRCVGLGAGYLDVHTSRESQSIPELIAAGELVAALIKAAAGGL